ncbi:hypothetical protein HUN01_01790 (plasmid) [Nostoc edaphicum CCNP1411]|uniref:Uncharacterized protein n=1 Tax=Nostoc edaphicum CCNP1411 TaxID=1472755 RepID=A0A7D7LBH2_9NOSO|nr:hypothetical protein [Nostoc edaphicum]QMS86372.1 hypothetical protein HUN01_01790 [Nostoc edaphicum CCNP1411]
MEFIADVPIGTPVQVYNLVPRQWQPEAVRDYWKAKGFLVVRCGGRGLFSVESGQEESCIKLYCVVLQITENHSYTLNAVSKVLVTSG